MPDPPPLPHADKPLTPPPALPFLSLAALQTLERSRSDLDLVDLDERSWEHVERLLRQSLGNMKVSETKWVDPFLKSLHALARSLTPELLASVTESSIAEWKSSELAARAAAVTKGKKEKEKKGKEKEVATSEEEGKEREKEKEKRRAGWRAARELLAQGDGEASTPTASTSSLSLVVEVPSSKALSKASSESEERAAKDESATDASDTETTATTNEHHQPKLTHFQLKLKAIETTVGAVKSGTTKLRLEFVEGEWEGRQLFGRDSANEFDEEDLDLISLVGGTFHLTATSKDLPKLERILELLAFAALSLKLEAHLLYDTSSPRPALEDTVSEAGTGTITPVPSSTPGLAKDQLSGLADRPSEEGKLKKSESGHKSKWSHSKLWGFLVGNGADSSSASHTSSASASTAASIRSVSPPATPAPRRVKDRFKGFGENFRLRSARSRRADGRSDTSSARGVSMEYDDFESDWDFIGGLGLGIGNGTPKAVAVEVAPATKEERITRPPEEEEPTDRFQKVIKKMERCILSTSPGVVYPPPHLLVRLRQQEIAQSHAVPPPPLHPPPLPSKLAPLLSAFSPPQQPPLHRLRSFPAIDAQTLAIGFASGNRNLPELSAPGSMSSTSPRATRITLDARAGLASLLTNNNSLGGTIRHQGMQFLVETICLTAGTDALPCKPPKWISFDYFNSHDPSPHAGTTAGKDFKLGQLVELFVAGKDVVCGSAACKKPGHDHAVYWMHSNERISISLATIPLPVDEPTAELDLNATTPPFESTHPKICLWTICKTCHATTAPMLMSAATYSFSFAKFAELLLYDPNFVPLPDLCEHAMKDREALVRSFSIGRTVVRIEVDQIELFELRLPTSVDPDIADDHEAAAHIDRDADTSAVEVLRGEIRSFYESVKERLGQVQESLEQSVPSTTIKGKPSLPDLGSEDHKIEHERSESEKTILELDSAASRSSPEEPDTVRGGAHHPLYLLDKLREGFEHDQVDLLALTEDLSPSQLNNGRWQFLNKAKATKARIVAWESKHLADIAEKLPPPNLVQPEYFDEGVHVFPVNSSVIFREKELSSAIALALSAHSFQVEVATPSMAPSRRVTPQGLWGSATPETSRRSSRQPIPAGLFEPTSASVSRSSTPPRSPRPTFFSMATATAPDPDDPSAEFGPVEEVEYLAKQKKGARPGSILSASMRGLSRQKSSESFNFFRSSPLLTPTGEEAQLGEDTKRNTGPIADTVLEDLVATSETLISPVPHSSRAFPAVISGVTKRHALSAATTTTSGVTLSIAEATPSHGRGGMQGSISSLSSFESSPAPSAASSVAGNGDEREDDVLHPLDPPERLASRFLGSLNALRNLPGSLRMQGSFSPRLPGLESSAGHVKFNFRQGDKAFRVTAWFAQRFQTFRSRSGLSEDLFIESISRCSDIHPEGGKSKAAFWMSGDKRFMLKELVTAWGVSERDAFLTFAPSLLDYLEQTQRPSLLAKIFGFYTLKTKNLKTGEVVKLDLVVLEHLFHSQNITRQFDLKGIASRVAKQKAAGADAKQETGWDGDWLSGSLRARLLIYSHSKTLLRDALLNDTTFLSQAGNIDYSLLVGVDDTRKELVVGLIDTLGVYNTLKMVENASKTVLKKATGSDVDAVTIQPPSDYAARFRQALDSYFVSVPEKFSRPPNVDESVEHDPRLSSVL